MTQSEVSNIVMIVMAFLVGGVVLVFIATGTSKAESEASNRVQIDNQDTLYQLIMYDTLIAHVCDDSVNSGALDNSGSRMYDSWKSYRDLWETYDSSISAPASGTTSTSLFDGLNKTFPRPELSCFGTGTTVGATSVGSYVDPTSKEWRNDQEGKYSKIPFTINSTEDFKGFGNPAGDPVWVGPCFWFDQPKDSQAGGFSLGSPRDSPGDGKYGTTDASFYFTKPDHQNFYFRYWGGFAGVGGSLPRGSYQPAGPATSTSIPGCNQPWRQSTTGGGSNLDKLVGGPGMTVTFIDATGSGLDFRNSRTMTGWPTVGIWGGRPRALGGKLDSYDASSSYVVGTDSCYNRRRCGSGGGYNPKMEIEYWEVKMCEGMTGYIQTNTGFTTSGSASFKDEQNPPYDVDNLPGFSKRERFQPENAPKDNSLHPFIVITDKGEC